MSYKVDLLDRSTLSKIKEIEIVNEPTINEEINGSFTFDFEAHYAAKNDLTNSVLISVDGKYFKIAKVVKSRDDSITLSVHCEHVSYELIIDFELTDEMEFESDAATMVTQFLEGTRFNLVSCMYTDVKYYNTKTLDIRKRLFEVANLFGGELIFDNYNISLVARRGADKGLDIELGVNLLGVTEEKNFVEGKTAYELDLLDLSQVNGYEMDFSSAELGDAITIKDNVLGINTSERILAINYNPFKKALPSVTVGDYIRDLTEYFKPTDEEDEEEKDIKTSFKQFKIGDVDLLSETSAESDNVIKFLKNKYQLEISASANFNVLAKSLKGVFVEKESNNTSILSIIKTAASDSEMPNVEIIEITSNDQLQDLLIKSETSIIAALSSKPLAHYKENPNDSGVDNIIAIGINVTFDDSAGIFLEKFSIGDFNVLSTDGNDNTSLIDALVMTQSTGPIANNAVEISERLKGLYVVPKDEYLKYHFTLIHTFRTDDGTDENVEDYDSQTSILPISNFRNFTVTKTIRDSVVLVVSSEPFENIYNGTATENVFYRAYGVTFNLLDEDDTPPETGGASEYLDEFRIGDVDMLPIASDETEQVKAYFSGETAHVIASATYETSETMIGIFQQLKEQYASYHVTVINHYTDDDGSVVNGFNTWDEVLEWNTSAETPYNNEDDSWIFVISDVSPFDITAENVNDIFIKAFGVTIKKAETPPPEMKDIMYAYLSESDYNSNKSIRETVAYRLKFINNITDFRTDFLNEDFVFTTSGTTSEYYPISYSAQNTIINLFENPTTSGVMVQVTDGVITNALDRLYSSS